VEEFESQLRYLKRYHSLLPLEDVVEFVVSGKTLPPNPVSITFDDGYHDNFSLAFPVLQDYQCSAAFFLTTDFIGTGIMPFHDQIIFGLCNTRKKRVHIDNGNDKRCEFPLQTPDERVRSFLKIQTLFKTVQYEKRASFVRKLLARLEVEVDKTFSEDLMLTWKEVEIMHSQGHSFYSHTRSHPLLSKLNGEELNKEVLESNKVIVQELFVESHIFCYPYGRKGEFDRKTIHFLKSSGFIAACSAIHGLNRYGQNPFNIKRTAAISEPIEKFSLRASGLIELLKELQSRWERN
jgi:peptidoglycan/xylan/chitin deacetylase (PgdA/CDA1 family)